MLVILFGILVLGQTNICVLQRYYYAALNISSEKASRHDLEFQMLFRI